MIWSRTCYNDGIDLCFVFLLPTFALITKGKHGGKQELTINLSTYVIKKYEHHYIFIIMLLWFKV